MRTRSTTPSVADALKASLRTYARQNKASLVVVKDFPAKYRSALETFVLNGGGLCPDSKHADDATVAFRYENWDVNFRTLSKATRKDYGENSGRPSVRRR